jgi:hypothetical protein
MPTAGPTLTAAQVDLLRRVAAGAVQGRRGREPAETEDLVALGLAYSTWAGHAGMQIAITPAGERLLAELDLPPPATVYDVPGFMAELTAFLERWGPDIGEERLSTLKRNLAYLIDLATHEAQRLERERLRAAVAALIEDERTDEPTMEAALALLADPTPRTPRGTSSRAR